MRTVHPPASLANPVLFVLAGLCPVLIPSFTLQNGLILGLGVAVHAALLAAAIPGLSKLTSGSLLFYLSLTVSGIAATLYGLAVRFVFPVEALGLSPFLAFISLNCFGMAVLRGSLRQGGLDRAAEYVRSALVLVLTWAAFAAARELIGSGMITFYDAEGAHVVLDLRALVRFPIRLALLPAGAFLLLGYGSALYRLRSRRGKDQA